MPLWSSPRPSSRAEQSIPSWTMPRIGLGSIARPSGITVPGVASGTTSPASMLNAPHHTCRSIAVAGVDEHAVDLGRVGVALGAQHAGGDDAGHGRADDVDLLDRHAE